MVEVTFTDSITDCTGKASFTDKSQPSEDKVPLGTVVEEQLFTSSLSLIKNLSLK